MVDEPENLILKMLRDARETALAQSQKLDAHGASLTRIEKRIEDLFQTCNYALGIAAGSHLRHENLETRIDELTSRVDRLEHKQ